jgi:hypothetical protein
MEFLLVVNSHGRTRLARYYLESGPAEQERCVLEQSVTDIIMQRHDGMVLGNAANCISIPLSSIRIRIYV